MEVESKWPQVRVDACLYDSGNAFQQGMLPMNEPRSCTPHPKPHFLRDSEEVCACIGNSGNHLGSFITFVFQKDKGVPSVLSFPK